MSIPYSFGVMIISILVFAVWLIAFGLRKKKVQSKLMECSVT